MKKTLAKLLTAALIFMSLEGCTMSAAITKSDAAEKTKTSENLVEYAQNYLSIPLMDCALEATGTLHSQPNTDVLNDELYAEYTIHAGKEQIVTMALDALYEKSDMPTAEPLEDETEKNAEKRYLEYWARIKLDNGFRHTPASLEVVAYYTVVKTGEDDTTRKTEIYVTKDSAGVMRLYVIG